MECAELARAGDLEGLKQARGNGCPWNEDTCALAAHNGHLEVLQWARQNGLVRFLLFVVTNLSYR